MPTTLATGRTRFQSTPLIRGATTTPRGCNYPLHISIHAPHTRGDFNLNDKDESKDISIHAPHTRGDLIGTMQSTVN